MQRNGRGAGSRGSHDLGASAPDFTISGEGGEKESSEGAGWCDTKRSGGEKEKRGRRIRVMARMMWAVTWNGMQKSLLSPSFV